MYPHPTGSAMERLWADEVRRLHALWHRGPPRSSPSPKPSAAAGLGPSGPTSFKRDEKRRKRREEKMQRKAAKKLAEQLSLCDSGAPEPDRANKASSSEMEWPCKPVTVPRTEAGWGDASQKPAAPVQALPASQEEQGRLAAMRVHQRALKTCRDFFSQESDVGEENEEEDDPMDEGGDGGGSSNGEDRVGSGYFCFFLDLFVEDGELRTYYEKNWEKGEFCCVVCMGMGVKAGKRYGDCVALVQHANSITKTKRKEAHRAFGRAICRVLGWDITRLPSIVLDMGDTLGQALAKPTGTQNDGIHKENDEILVEVPEPGGTDDGVHKQNGGVSEKVSQSGSTDDVHKQNVEIAVEVPQPSSGDDGVHKKNGEISVEVCQPGSTDGRNHGN